MKKLILIIFLLPNSIFGQSTLKDNSIGLAYVNGYEGTNGKRILIDVVFPSNYLINELEIEQGSHFLITTNLKIYNVSRSYLLLDTIGTFNFEMKFWCENDGGIQYRPTATLKIDSFDLLGDYLVDYEMQDLLGFVVINQNGHLNLERVDIQETPRIVLDIKGDEKPQAYIWTVPDEAQNCDGKPENNLMIYLRTKEGNFRMRCCGP